MAASGRGGKATMALTQGIIRTCWGCGRAPQSKVFRRLHSGGSTIDVTSSSATTDTTLPNSSTKLPVASHYPPPHPSSRYRIRSGLILTRAPLLTREQTTFEMAFYLYQKRLNERLAAQFRSQFYFKHDTAAELDWRLKLRERHGVAGKEVGQYKAQGRMGWNDELLVGSTQGRPDKILDKLMRDAEMRVTEDGEEIPEDERVHVEKPQPRRSEADENGDLQRLDRAMDRTLYLVVQAGKEQPWQFPATEVMTSENLHETASRVLLESAGVNMNTWIVGRVPVAHYVTEPVFDSEQNDSVKQRGCKTFFLKGRIMAGQADLKDNKHGLTDFRWLTKEELKQTLPQEYYHKLRNMMAER